ncbi:hypothetical protein ABBQ38_013440 [Trebouxia sp. C0009 RCD-2024]
MHAAAYDESEDAHGYDVLGFRGLIARKVNQVIVDADQHCMTEAEFSTWQKRK